MIKDALLHGKRRPFEVQKMPFYNVICNLLIILTLQKANRTDFLCSTKNTHLKVVRLFQTTHSQLLDIPHNPQLY